MTDVEVVERLGVAVANVAVLGDFGRTAARSFEIRDAAAQAREDATRLAVMLRDYARTLEEGSAGADTATRAVAGRAAVARLRRLDGRQRDARFLERLDDALSTAIGTAEAALPTIADPELMNLAQDLSGTLAAHRNDVLSLLSLYVADPADDVELTPRESEREAEPAPRIPSSGAAASDPYLADRLERLLGAQEGLADDAVQVTIIDSGIVLQGTVDSRQERAKAESLVEEATPAGVNIENRLHVRSRR
jgi:hypothetical protein